MISVLIVNHNGESWLEECLAGFGSPLPDDIQLVMVDNASTDGSVDLVETRFPHVELIRLEDNIGFGMANNLAAECARGELLLLLNNDARIGLDCVRRLQARLGEDERLAQVSARLVGADGRPRFSWSPDRSVVGEAVQRIRNPFEGRAFNHHDVLEGGLRLLLGRGWYTAACVLIRRRAFTEVGGFDPVFFLYFEDVDLCVRLKRRGWRSCLERGAVAVHYGGGGLREEDTALWYRHSQLYYYRKHRPSWEELVLKGHLKRKYRDDKIGRWLRHEVASDEWLDRLLTDTIRRLGRAAASADLPTRAERCLEKSARDLERRGTMKRDGHE